MSAPAPPPDPETLHEPEAAPEGGPGRYQRSAGGLVGAIILTVVVVFGFVLFRGTFRDNEPTQVPAVDYAAWVSSGRSAGALQVFAPATLPDGWRATSASYQGGKDPAWQLGLLTDESAFVGVRESRVSVADLVREHVDENATRDGEVTISGTPWRVYRDDGGDYAVARTLTGRDGQQEAVLVFGDADDEVVRKFAGSLRTK